MTDTHESGPSRRRRWLFRLAAAAHFRRTTELHPGHSGATRALSQLQDVTPP